MRERGRVRRKKVEGRREGIREGGCREDESGVEGRKERESELMKLCRYIPVPVQRQRLISKRLFLQDEEPY